MENRVILPETIEVVKGPFSCNFISNMEALYLTDMELKSEYKAVVR